MSDLPEDDPPGSGGPEDSAANEDAEPRWKNWRVGKRQTGDPELDQLWAMSFGELEAILDDPQHPLHEKAKQVSRELTEPLAQMAKNVLAPIAASVSKSDISGLLPTFDVSALLSKVDLSPVLAAYDSSSWISKAALNLPKIDVPTRIFDRLTTIESVPALRLREHDLLPEIDYDTIEPPDMTVAEIAEITETRMSEVRDTIVEHLPTMVGLLAELVREAKSNSEASKQSLKWSKVAGVGAIIGAVVAALGIVATAIVALVS